MPMPIPYTPPAGYYDLPFTWVFDASSLTDGNIYQNLFVFLQGGYGDFLMRRMLDFSRILVDDMTGTFQVRDGGNWYFQSAPVQFFGGGEVPCAPEIFYKELGSIKFDLNGILKPSNPLTAQIAFQGSRRLPGVSPRAQRLADIGPVKPKTYTYQCLATITAAAPAGPVTVNTKVNDYDFELYQLMLFRVLTARLLVFVPDVGLIYTLTAIAPGPAGNLISFAVTGQGVPNSVAAVTVAGNAISVSMGNDGAGNPVTTNADLFALLIADAQVAALVTMTINPATAGLFPLDFGPSFLTGGVFQAIDAVTSCCGITLFDKNRVQCSNLPVLDIFYNGAPQPDRNRPTEGAPYAHGGAIVPPLYYQKDNQIRIDVTNLLTDPAAVPYSIAIYMIGMQLMPCGGMS